MQLKQHLWAANLAVTLQQRKKVCVAELDDTGNAEIPLLGKPS